MPTAPTDPLLRAARVEGLFRGLAARFADVFWMDAGAGAGDGVSWLGAGERVDTAEVESVALSESTDGDPFPDWVGWFGYEPEASRWMRVTHLLAFDHASGQIRVLRGEPGLTRLIDAAAGAEPPARVSIARHTAAEYAARIADCRRSIQAGDAYQLCLTTRFSVVGDIDPIEAYLRLRRTGRTGDGGCIRIGDTALASASPEQFLHILGGVARTSPIKGTRPRGATADEDARLIAELRSSVKERAENVMIVDLVRNDLARVSEPASVTVERLLAVDTYPEVHQLVSTVSGRLLPGTDLGALLAATFPAGSMTGAPKESAMSILRGLEGGPRDVYAGSFGWVSASGAARMSMTIRAIVTHPGGAYVGAGGGITWRSDPDDEVAEAALKARGPLAAIGATLPDDWR